METEKIPFFSPPHLDYEEIQYIESLLEVILDSGKLSNGQFCRELEDMIKEMYGVKHAITCSSGTIGLWIVLRALNPKTVAMPAFTWKSLAEIVPDRIAWLDIDRETWLPIVDGERVDAFIINLTFGNVEDYSEIIPQDSTLIYDAAHSLGSRLLDIGNAAVFSLSPTKPATSVDWQEPIIVADEEDIVGIKQIGEFVDQFFQGDEEGIKEIRDKKWKTLSFTMDGKLEYKAINKVSRHHVHSPLLRLRASGGRDVMVTADHSIFCFRNGEITCDSTDKLREGDHLPVLSRLPVPKELKIVDLYDLFVKSLDPEEIRKHKVKIRRFNNGLHPKNRGWGTFIGERKRFYGDDEYIYLAQSSAGKYKLPRFMKITPELCRLLGYYVAEGSATYRKEGLTLTFSSNEETYVSDAIHCIQNTFGNEIRIWRKLVPLRHRYEIKFGGKIHWLLFVRAFGINERAQNKRVPSFIFNCSEENIREFLKGYFRGDGCIRLQKTPIGHYSYECGTVSRMLAEDLRYLFLRLGIPTSKYCFQHKDERWSTCFSLAIRGKKFLRQLGPLFNNEKDTILQTILNNDVDEKEHSHITTIRKSVGNLSSVKITRIEQKKATYGFVYDLSVDGERFIGGSGGFCLHNSCEGGIIITDDDELAKRMIELRDNCCRMSEIQAVIGQVYLGKLGQSLSRRVEIWNFYRRRLPFTPQKIKVATSYSVYGMLLEPEQRAKLIERIKDKIEYKIYYTPLKSGLINTEFVAGRILCIPSYPDVNENEVVRIINEAHKETVGNIKS